MHQCLYVYPNGACSDFQEKSYNLEMVQVKPTLHHGLYKEMVSEAPFPLGPGAWESPEATPGLYPAVLSFPHIPGGTSISLGSNLCH